MPKVFFEIGTWKLAFKGQNLAFKTPAFGFMELTPAKAAIHCSYYTAALSQTSLVVFRIEQPAADAIVRRKVIPEMKDADVLTWGKTVWYFDHIPSTKRCFEHTVSLIITF